MTGDLRPLLVSRAGDPAFADAAVTRIVRVGNAEFGGERPVFIAGPCAVESRTGLLEVAEAVAAAGADLLRGGAFKPRTSPYSFQGLGREGLELLAEARSATGLPFVTEVMDPRQVELVGGYADVLQIGSRSMQNFPLLREAGRFGKPVLLKRGFGNTVDEWIHAAEYLAVEGNLDVILCERGIRAFGAGDHCHATLDLAAVETVRRRTFLPVIVDPSHAAGRFDLVPPLSRAALAAGAQGLMIEVAASAEARKRVRCDGPQGILPETLADIIRYVPVTSATGG